LRHFGEDFTDLDRDEAAARLLVGAQLLAEEADELPALGRRHIAPDEKRGMRSIDDLARFECVHLGDMRDNLARYRRGYGKGAVRGRKAGDAKRGERLQLAQSNLRLPKALVHGDRPVPVPDRCQFSANSRFVRVCRFAKCLKYLAGWVAEWFKAPVLKTGVGSRPPGVRIPPHPPFQS
jgi:hypothetical protein